MNANDIKRHRVINDTTQISVTNGRRVTAIEIDNKEESVYTDIPERNDTTTHQYKDDILSRMQGLDISTDQYNSVAKMLKEMKENENLELVLQNKNGK